MFIYDMCFWIQRCMTAKVTEVYCKTHVPMWKHGMVSGHSYSQAIAGDLADRRASLEVLRHAWWMEEGSVVASQQLGQNSFSCYKMENNL